ncbi:MAG: hypothetical protein F4Y42_10530 [Caldilineaceae bacterium SB0664_bin_27]|uniref:Uncharacterized protein n=1 Tax=Caldilineaceae bacterium SB0664_bin_27 TaxID=2605260 RepID=A0A6B0YV50_9CHLR|nr:hypothetical protein [Caldilineaceae bacterium SB0664_bin_27]
MPRTALLQFNYISLRTSPWTSSVIRAGPDGSSQFAFRGSVSVQFRTTHITSTKPSQKLYTASHEQPHCRTDFPANISSKSRSRGTSISADFCMKVMQPYRCTFFAPFFACFGPISLWSGAQKLEVHHYLGKCNTFAALFAHTAAPQKDRPSTIEMMI